MNRKTIIIFLALLMPFWVYSQAQKMDTVKTVAKKKMSKAELLKSTNDGPYIFIEDDRLVEKNIVEGKVITKSLAKDAFKTEFKRDKSKYKKVAKIAALSDIHGQHELAVEILTNHHIIDSLQNWTYGEGHLVIVGDIFDRGPLVNETLWLLYKLEQQAEAAGGKVHVLLGNHEYLVFQNDLRYIHKKYRIVSALFKTSYTDLYGPNTVMGRWLRSKNTVIKINSNTFVHGGISKEFLGVTYNINEINRIMGESIDVEETVLDSTGISYHYFGEKGPVWYRGYFRDSLPDSEISDILSEIYSKHIVVGHCSNETVVELYDGKVYGVDSSIKKGEYGELLLIEDKKYYRGTKDGERIGF
ncbi:MAG: metallophosphoesterase [Saprospiraceae bacterium]